MRASIPAERPDADAPDVRRRRLLSGLSGLAGGLLLTPAAPLRAAEKATGTAATTATATTTAAVGAAAADDAAALAVLPASARSVLPPLRGEPGGVLLLGAVPLKRQIGQVNAFDGGKWLAGPAVTQVDDERGRTRADGSSVVARVENPYRAGSKAIRMTLRAQDQPEGAKPYRTQISNDPGIGGVTEELPRLGRNWRFLVVYFGEFPKPFPGTMVIDQLHANKERDSWGSFSPPMSLELMDNRRGGVLMRAKYHAASITARASRPSYVTRRDMTLVDDVRPGQRYEILWDTNVSFKDDGWWRLWVNGQQLTIVDKAPTTYPMDGLELDANGVEKLQYNSFWTLSQYLFHYQAGGDWKMDMYVVASGARRHRDGMTSKAWLDALAAL